MKKIKLSQGKFALVSDTDYTYLNQWKWHVIKRRNLWHAVRHGPTKPIYMHRIILERMGFKDFERTDHKNLNGLDNYRRNLRPATTQQNGQNRTQQINNKSGIKGVSWRKDRSKWRATIKINGKQTHLGYFNDPLIAARAYNRAAKRYHGKFARVTHPFGV